MSVRSSITAKFNYTGRKRLPHQKETIKIYITERRPDSLDILIQTDVKEIMQRSKISKDKKIQFVLDSFYRGNCKRFVLSEDVSKYKETIEDCPDQVNPTFRFLVVSNDNEDKGKVLAATNFFSALDSKSPEMGPEKRNDFFNIERSNSLGGLVWLVDWEDTSNPKITVNGRLFDKGYGDQSKELRTLILPAIVREIITGLVFRVENLDDLQEDSMSYKWRLFFEQRLNMDFSDINDESENQDRLDKVNEAVTAFMSVTWYNGKTLLEELVGD